MLVFDFLPAYPDSSGVSAPIGESGYEGAEECVAKVGQIAEMPQDSAAFREDGCGYAAQVGRFGKTTLPLFIPEKMAHGAEIAEGGRLTGLTRLTRFTGF